MAQGSPPCGVYDRGRTASAAADMLWVGDIEDVERFRGTGQFKVSLPRRLGPAVGQPGRE